MTSKVEGFHAGEFVVSEGRGSISRDAIIVASGADLVAGTVLGQITLGAETSAAGTNTGNGVLGAVTLDAAARLGVYSLRVTKAASNAGDFEVIDPNGAVVGVGTVGVAFHQGGVAFTLADGATDFVVGDTFTLTVAAGSEKYVGLTLAATNGSENAVAVLFDHAPAASADVNATAITREAEVNGAQLTWPAGITDLQKATAIAQLAKKFIIVR